MVVFGEKLLYSRRIDCNRAKVCVFVNSRCIWKGGCIRAKVVVFGQKCFLIWQIGIIGKLVVFWQGGCIRGKLVIFVQRDL